MTNRPIRLTILLVLGLLLPLGAAATADAVVTLTATRTEVLYSAGDEPDCTALSALPDDGLPFHVIRLRATVEGGAPPTARYRWSLPRPAAGMLVADEPLASNEVTAAITGFCADFGNACVLTEEQLKFYNKPTVLWVAPTCADLPDRTDRAFAGDTVRFRVKVTDGRRRLGRAKVIVGYGRLGQVTLLANGQDGLGRPDGVSTGINPSFSAVEDRRGQALPALEEFKFENGAGDSETSPTACCVEDLLYRSSGRFTAVLTERLVDGSALCDKLRCRVGTCEADPQLKVLRTPGRRRYRDGEAVDFTLRLKNNSPRGGCDFLLVGRDVIRCDAELKVGGTTDTRSNTVGLQHCSVTTTQGCQTDEDCACTNCEENEFCVTFSHCSESVSQPCASDADCRAPLCPTCKDGERCIQILNFSSLFVPVGATIDLIHKSVTLQNALPDTAKFRETWHADVFNLVDDPETTVRYKVRGRR